MSFGIASYIITTIIFAGGAVAIELIFAYKDALAYKKLIAVLILLALVFTPIEEYSAFIWNAWIYSPIYTLNIRFLGAEIETYLYIILVGVAIAIPTLICSDYEENGLPLLASWLMRLRKRLGIFTK